MKSPSEIGRVNEPLAAASVTKKLKKKNVLKRCRQLFQGHDDFDDVIDSPKAPSGFVKSMCRLYSESFGLRKAASCGPQKGTDLNR